jgi:hypothetical protein
LTDTRANGSLTYDGTNLLINGNVTGTSSEQLLANTDRTASTVLEDGSTWVASVPMTGSPAVHEYILNKKYENVPASAVAQYSESTGI